MPPKPIAGRYDVLETLHSDGRGEELRARDQTLGREVLLVRRPCAVQLDGRASVDRALREARALAGLRHPSIQKLHDVVEDEGGPTLVLEPVAGETLEARLARETKLEPEEVRRLGIELADALATVHAAGAVHRDVSEHTIVLRGDGSPCLTGFRLAKPATMSGATSIQYGQVQESGSCKERVVLPHHPAPEQLAGEAASARTDLFALACVLYRALTGREAMPDHLAGGWRPPTDPVRLVPGTPPVLAKQILACLSRSPIGRPQSAIEFRDALRTEKPARAKAAEAGVTSAPSAAKLGMGLAAAVALALLGWQFWPRAAAVAPDRGLATTNESAHSPDARYQASYRKTHALLIGIGQAYEGSGFPPLSNAARDVQALDESLRALPNDNWEPEVLLDGKATQQGILNALYAMEDALDPEDRVLIYFAGHGVPHERSETSGWLIPADGKSLDKDPNARTNWLQFETLKTFLGNAVAKHVLLAMDCCYSGRMGSSRSAGAEQYKKAFLTEPAVVVLASGRPNEKVSDGVTNGHSPFADVFLESLAGRTGGLTSSALYNRMSERFLEQSLPQKPTLRCPENMTMGEFVFLLGD
jgi:hypothetical protein